jgi:DNA-binding NtrC family response regulator
MRAQAALPESPRNSTPRPQPLTPVRRRILVVDDDPDCRALLATSLEDAGYATVCVGSGDAALASLDTEDADVVVTDLEMPGLDGLQLSQRIAQNHPGVPVVVITAFGNLENAVEAMRAGAYDFLTKPLDQRTLAVRIERVMRERELRELVKRLESSVQAGPRFEELIGESPAIHVICEMLTRVADTDASVLITGESGTGKEVVARALHHAGSRRAGPFVAVNCSAMPEALLESELFGHARGAFTDARTERAGLFEVAHGGTLLLDEIGDMPLTLQPKLLRALEERSVRPIGANREIPFDVRIIAATNQDLEAAVAEHRFREDLFFRLSVIQLELPPLRARGNDALLLCQHFLQKFARRSDKAVVGILPAAAEKLLSYSWPGNVRELKNCMERAVALTRYEQITVDDLPERVRSYKRAQVVVTSDDPTELLSMDEVERRYVAQVMEAVGGNKTLAARVLGYDRTTLYRKLERYQQDGNRDKPATAAPL